MVAIAVLLALYAAIGFVFALVFLTLGLTRVDPQTRGAALTFRLLIFPGVAALWPVLLGKWLR